MGANELVETNVRRLFFTLLLHLLGPHCMGWLSISPTFVGPGPPLLLPNEINIVMMIRRAEIKI